MYADFDAASFSAMSNSHPPVPEKAPEPAQSEGPPKPTSESLCARQNTAQEEEGNVNKRGAGSGDHDGREARRTLVSDVDSPQEGVAESSGAGQDGPSKEAVKGGGDDRHDNDDEDGYFTPTSPRHRIPTDLPCPPAPKKVRPKRWWQKRKGDDQEIYRVGRRRLQFSGEFELVLRPVVEDDPSAGLVDHGAGGGHVDGWHSRFTVTGNPQEGDDDL